MRAVIARIFDSSLDGIVAEEGTSFCDCCRILPDDPMQLAHERDFFANAAGHIMGRTHDQDAAQYVPLAVDHPYADVMNAARKVIFSQTMQTIDWANSSLASGDLGAEMEKLKQDGHGSSAAHGGIGFWRSLICHDLIEVYRSSLFPYLAGKGARLFSDLEHSRRLELVSTTAQSNGMTELAFRRSSQAPSR